MIRTAVHIGLGLLLALYVGFFVAKTAADIRCPHSLDYEEGFVLSQGLRLAHGETLYNDYRHYPFVFSNYPPFFVALTAATVPVWGASFAPGRILAVLSMLGVAVMMGLLLRRAGARWPAALGAPAFLLSTSWVTYWAGLLRVDTLALLLSTAGLYCVMRRGRWLVPAVALFLAGTYTKQSTIAALGAGCLYLWWIGQRRQAVGVAGTWAGLGAALFLGATLATHGRFYQHMVSANIHPWYLDRMLFFLLGMVMGWPVLVAMAVAGVVVLLVSNRRAAPGKAPEERLLLLYLGVAAAASFTVGKGGTHVNHLLDLLTAACLVAGLAYDRLLGLRPSVPATLLWAGVAVAIGVQLYTMWSPPSRWVGYRESYAQGSEAALRLIRRTPGDIIGGPPGPLVLAGRPLLLDPATAAHLALSGVWDQTPLLQDIRARRFGLIYMTKETRDARPEHGLYGSMWTVAQMQAIRTHYRPLPDQPGNLAFFVPAGRP